MVDYVAAYKKAETELQEIMDQDDPARKTTLLREMDSLLECMTPEDRDSVMPTKRLLSAVNHRGS